ncbi:MAG: glycoside hydrolase family 3 C-terminal domain-containing protein [Oscillospiraceae bacterium]|nr:glycoside hydrolase family 3 C-terminal domain-containing protein [Oscillospiraceae bacterium]
MRQQALELVTKLTTEEKLLLIKGMGSWHTHPIERLDLPSIMMADGPHGLRKQDQGGDNPMGLGKSTQTVCFPTASGTGASFDRDLLHRLGEILGQECRAHELGVLLGPGVNIKRSPLCGRNFEYFSEDPYLSSEMAVSYTQGVQAQGVGVSIKHYAANNQEKRRMTTQSVVDERAMREIYLPSFEQTVKRADPWTVMCAYNRLFDGIYCSENKRLLTEILRDEWGFGGLVVSDWGAVSDRVAGIEAGLDLEMPDSRDLHTDLIHDALDSGTLSQAALDEAATRVVELVLRAVQGAAQDVALDAQRPACPEELNVRDHALAREIARDTMVLLQNDGVLPLSRAQSGVAFIGGFAKQPRYQGGGSSHVNAYHVASAYETAKTEGLAFEYAEGFGASDYNYDVVKARAAIDLAEKSELVVVFAGLPTNMDNEGADRKHLDLPPCQNQLIAQLAAVQKNIVVVLCNGAPVRMPWAGQVRAVLESYLAGEAVGEAQIDLLYGAYSPNAKLAETFPLRVQDTPCFGNFPGGTATVEYRESIYVGYRYYDKADKDVLFPFGHGLTYSKFDYTNLRVSKKNITPDDIVNVSVTITNTGNFDAAEVVQFYVAPPADDSLFRAPQELKGFGKVFLKAGEKKRVTVSLDSRAFAYYHVGRKAWHCAPGDYTIHAAASSRDIRLSSTVKMNSEAADAPYPALPCYAQGLVHAIPDSEFEAVLGHAIPPANFASPRELTWDSTLEDATQSPFGRVIAKIIDFAFPIVCSIAQDTIGDASGMKDTVMEMPVRSIAMWSGGLIDRRMVNALVSIFNEEAYLKSICDLVCGGVRAVKKVVGKP